MKKVLQMREVRNVVVTSASGDSLWTFVVGDRGKIERAPSSSSRVPANTMRRLNVAFSLQERIFARQRLAGCVGGSLWEVNCSARRCGVDARFVVSQ